MFKEYLEKVLKEKNSELGPEPLAGDLMFDYNGDFIGIMVKRENEEEAMVHLFYNKNKERFIKETFRNKEKLNG